MSEIQPQMSLPTQPIQYVPVEAVRQLIKDLFEEYGITPKRDVPPEWVPKEHARTMLLNKGYLVKSDKSFRELLTDQKVKRTKKGHEYWYKTEQIINIPNRLGATG